ncbi:MAG: tetratricopeptide repeat protein [Zoogloeaceae bacterium]|nr:tetratricopeptide repeat protein [Zoogloeaceae bacterium]
MKFEYPLVLENYRHIRDVGDLLRIFPEAREYCGHPDADPDFVLAMSILKFSCNASAKSFAKRILFELISNPSRAEKIESIHNFSIVNFVEITGQDDAAPYVECSSLQAGIAAFSNEDFATAISLFTALLETEPTNPLPPAYLAFIAARQEDAKAAADFIEISGRLAPERADLKATLGESFLKAGNPALAARYLEEAISARPDLLDAYPAYAQSLHLTGQSEAAVTLLQSAAGIASPTQAAIRNVLLEILIQRGDLDEFTRACLRFSRGLADDLLAARCLSRFDPEGEHLLETLGHVQRQLADACTDETDKPAGKRRTPGTPLRIAFLAGDFAQEERLQRLPALLRHLPAERFRTFLFTSDPHGDCANFCALLADRVLPIHAMHDADVLQAIHAAAPDILIDLDAYGPTERLTVFLQAEVPEKFLWGEAPMPPLSPRCRVLTGARLADAESFAALPHATLPEMGEYCDLPDLPMETPSRPAEKPARLACLTPAMRIGREGWRLFAEVLKMCPASALRLNLQYLGDAARDFIRAEFARAGVAAERLDFVRAHTPKDLCRFWREVDLGLAPPTDAGDPALPACLWMGRPYLALASPLPWSRRPAALLELAGAREWIAQTPEDYINRAQQLPIAPNPDFRARMEKAGMNNPQIFAQGFAESMTALFAR